MTTIYESARTSAARLLNANEGEIALTDNTGEGLNIISFGFDWREGDEVITTNHEHISALAPLYQLRDRYGIVIRTADLGPVADQPVLKAIADLVTPRTRLIVLSHVTWTTGALLNISEVAYMGREHGIPVLVDGAQSAGAIPIDVKAWASISMPSRCKSGSVGQMAPAHSMYDARHSTMSPRPTSATGPSSTRKGLNGN